MFGGDYLGMNLLSKYTKEACLCVQSCLSEQTMGGEGDGAPNKAKIFPKEQFKVGLHPCSFSTRR